MQPTAEISNEEFLAAVSKLQSVLEAIQKGETDTELTWYSKTSSTSSNSFNFMVNVGKEYVLDCKLAETKNPSIGVIRGEA
jgi:hypothetical protein